MSDPVGNQSDGLKDSQEGNLTIEQLYDKAYFLLDACTSTPDCQALEVAYLGKKGLLTLQLQRLGKMPREDRPAFGQRVNVLKTKLSKAIAQKKEALSEAAMTEQMTNESIDITLPGRGQNMGTLHPITIVTNRLVKILCGLGFSTASGPELEDDYHNFEALNFPPDHPARDMQDTFFTKTGLLLRTHTSSVQIRTLEKTAPPIKVIAPGKAFRADSIDATHTPMFHQIEALAVDTHLNFSDLKSLVYNLLSQYFAEEVKVRFRPSFFPFTEPSAEVDLWHNGKWLEVMGCGMVHPNVLKKSDIDPSQYTGYAFGLGIDRLTMLTYGINDLRDLFSNDVRFLAQFNRECWGEQQ